MATFVTTVKFTQQGLQNIKETGKRAGAVKATAKKMGVKVREIYWTLGAFDGVVIFDAPDDETATALMLSVASLGNIQSQTARAFDAGAMQEILAKMP